MVNNTARHDVKQTKRASFCHKVIENKAYQLLFSSAGIGLHQQICKEIGFEPDVASLSVSQGLACSLTAICFTFQTPQCYLLLVQLEWL